jgi:CBS domain-containing protein
MDTGIKVGDLMTRNFISVPPKTSLKKCAKMMTKKGVGSLLIEESNELKGIITEKDIVWAVSKKTKQPLEEIEVKDIMKKKVIGIKPGADITQAMRKFKSKKVRRLPVIENKKLIGLLTTNDIIKIDPELFQAIAETIKIKEEKEKIKRSGIKAKRKYSNCEECGEFDITYQDDHQWLCDKCFSKR